MAIIQAAANVARALFAVGPKAGAQFHRAGVQQLRTGADGGAPLSQAFKQCETGQRMQS